MVAQRSDNGRRSTLRDFQDDLAITVSWCQGADFGTTICGDFSSGVQSRRSASSSTLFDDSDGEAALTAAAIGCTSGR
jgi:hypothetical protein